MNYTLVISPRSKHIRITIKPDGQMKITCPIGTKNEEIERFLETHKEWIQKTLKKIEKRNRFGYVKIDGDYTIHKESARAFIQDRIHNLNKHYNVAWNDIRIRNQKTRWGSCSSKGNLNFHFALVLIPPHLADYIIVHELCHRLEMNHGPNFWSQVSKEIPDYKLRIKELKKYHL